MWRRRLRNEHVDPLLSGSIPEGREDLADLSRALDAIRSFADTTAPDDPDLIAAAAAAAAANQSAHSPDNAGASSSAGGRRWAARGLASGIVFKIVLGAAVALAGTAGAAAAGILPGPVQRFVEATADVVGISRPLITTTSTTEATTTTLPPTTTTEAPQDTTSTTTSEPATTSTSAATTTTTTIPLPVVALDVTVLTDEVYEPGGLIQFQIDLTNLSDSAATLAGLDASGFGDLLGDATGLSETTCPAASTGLDAGAIFSCTFSAQLSGESDTPFETTVTTVVEDADGGSTTASTTASVVFLDSPAAVSVDYTVSAGSVLETGEPVVFSATVTNDSHERGTLATLVDAAFGDVLDPANPLVSDNTCTAAPKVFAPGQRFNCEFTAQVAGSTADGRFATNLTAKMSDDEQRVATGRGHARVDLEDVLPSFTVTKTASTNLVATTEDTVSFTVVITNLSAEPAHVQTFYDQAFGFLLDPDNPALIANNCPVRVNELPPFGTITCTYAASGATPIGSPDHHHKVLVQLVDDEGNDLILSDYALVAYGPSGTRVAGVVFEDLNGNGTHDEGEGGIAGVRVDIAVADGWNISVTTGDDGSWSAPAFPGDATITVGAAGVPSDHTLTTGTTTFFVPVTSGEVTTLRDVGYAPPVLAPEPEPEPAP